MEKNPKKSQRWQFEQKTLAILTLMFVGVLLVGWGYALNLRHNIVDSPIVTKVDTQALVEVEKIRTITNEILATGRAYFLLGSARFYNEHKENREIFLTALASFEKAHTLPKIPELVQSIRSEIEKEEEHFRQGLEFRAKQTETRIVGQYYQSKVNPIRENINKALSEMGALHMAEFDKARIQADETASWIEGQIPRGMMWLSILTGTLFLSVSLLVVRMLRERKRHLADRARLYEEARRAATSRDEVMAAISQDLKEPLSYLQQAASIIEQTSDPETIKDGAEIIKSTIKMTEGIVHDILDQTKADQGELLLRLDQLGVDTIFEEARERLQPIAKKKDIRLEFNYNNPPALAFVDRDRVQRVLTNLVGNAIKFSPRNQKVIIKAKSDQQFVYISVKDSGPGIPEKQQENLFDNFWQARKTANQGAGVGLAIAKTIVEAHGGTISVSSHSGSGSTFTFSLPKRRPAGANIRKPSPPPVRTIRNFATELRDGPQV